MSELELEPIKRLSRDLRKAASTLSTSEARFLVDHYYMMQRDRIRAAHQVRQLRDSGEPHEVLTWLNDNTGVLEASIKGALGVYAASQPVGKWAQSITGIGPVIAAGFLAHIDINKAPTVGHIWRFAGLDPTIKWEKGKKRPYNARLKVLCWKAGESFKKFSGNDDCYYGRIYRLRKDYEVARNSGGENAEEAKKAIEIRKLTSEQKVHYEAGKLPPGRLDLRATRYAVKQFIADLHAYWYRHEFKKDPPLPYPIAILGHA